jgi:hypothetical protein
MSATGLTEEEAERAFEVIKSVGFTWVRSMELYRQTDNVTAYTADLGYTSSFLVMFAEREVYVISDDDSSPVYYDKLNGGVLDQITNYTLGIDEQATFMYLSEEMVKQVLLSPSSAKFPGAFSGVWAVGRDKDVVTVKAYVDSSNAFGVMVRNTYTAQFSYSSQELLCLIVDGKLVYGTVQKTEP